MKKKIIIGIIVALGISGVWYVSSVNKAKVMIKEFQQYESEFGLIMGDIERNLADKDTVQLQVNITNAQAKIDHMISIIENNTDGSVRVNANLDKLTTAKKGLNLIEQGVTNNNSSLTLQGIGLLQSINNSNKLKTQ